MKTLRETVTKKRKNEFSEKNDVGVHRTNPLTSVFKKKGAEDENKSRQQRNSAKTENSPIRIVSGVVKPRMSYG